MTLSLTDVLEQPGVLLDSGGEQVRTASDWSRRPPLVSRLRNREVPIEEDGQDASDDVSVSATGPRR